MGNLFVFALVMTVLTLPFSPMAAADDSQLRRAIDADSPRNLQAAMTSSPRELNELIDDTYLGPNSITLLGYAARSGAVRVTSYLLSLPGLDLNRPNRVQETPLMLAAFFKDWTDTGEPSDSYERHEQVVRLLVGAGAQLESIGNYSPLAYAAYNNHERIVEFLLASGARPDSDATLEKGANYPTGLMFAVMNDGKGSLRTLLNYGALVHIKNSYGLDSLALAKQYKRTNLMPYLNCAYGLNPGETYREKCGHLR